MKINVELQKNLKDDDKLPLLENYNNYLKIP